MALLRDLHGRMEEEVFRHRGCLEKFIGDALLATFGVPDVGRSDATDTLACARGMLAALDGLEPRARNGRPAAPLRMGVGLHYGQVVLGDIGSAAAWPSPPSATRRTSPAGCNPSPAISARVWWPAARSCRPSSGRPPTSRC